MVAYEVVAEGKAKVAVPKAAKISSSMPVFYNPVMRSNRDITILFMAAAGKLYGIRKWKAADPMAATGIRGIRMLLELGPDIESVAMNDYSADATRLIRRNLRLNKIRSKFSISQNESSKFLLNNGMFSYIDIDPFGYPGRFLDAAVRRLRHNGILAVTATDTSALSGSAAAACRRKYLASPLKNGFMHETAVRILVRFVQLFGSIHEKALTPVFCYSKEHYARAFFLCREGAGKVDKLLSQHRQVFFCRKCCEKGIFSADKCPGCGSKVEAAGPLWSGALFDPRLASAMAKSCTDEKLKEFLLVVAEEAEFEEKCGPGFFSLDELGLARQPKTSDVISALRKAGFAASRTHCSTIGIKANASVNNLLKIIKK